MVKVGGGIHPATEVTHKLTSSFFSSEYTCVEKEIRQKAFKNLFLGVTIYPVAMENT